MALRSELFLQKYRVLEGLLEKRYEGRRLESSSVVIEYLHEDDSRPVRVDLDLLREIRNLLSHNAGADGAAVVEPSQEMLDRLDAVTAYLMRPHAAADFGTPAERIFSAHPNDSLLDVMRNMKRRGYSHVPISCAGRFCGVLSVKNVFDYLAERGLDALRPDARVAELGDLTRIDRQRGERYDFVAENASIVSVRDAFERLTEPNNRLSMVFVTRTGSPEEPLICMLTPWDVLNEDNPGKGVN